VLAFNRGAHVVAINTTAEPRPVAATGEPVLATGPGVFDSSRLAAHGGVVLAGS
jgi:hypothetical protein